MCIYMEGDYLTKGDAALWADAKDGRRSYCDDYGRHHGRGMAATGIGLAAGLGGGALLLALAGIWGANQASKARYKAAENAAAGNAKSIDILAQTQLQDRLSRETWQNNHAPTISTSTYVPEQARGQAPEQMPWPLLKRWHLPVQSTTTAMA